MKTHAHLLILTALLLACTPQNPDAGKQPNPSQDAPSSQDPSASRDPEVSNDPAASEDPVSEEPNFEPEAWYETFFWDRTDRQKGGIRGPVKSIHQSTPKYLNDRYLKYTFDEAGHLLKMEHVQTDTDIYNYSLTYSYDDQGRRTGMTFQEGELTNGYTCEYENGDRYVAVSGTDWIHMYGVFVGDGNGYANCQDLIGIWKGLSAVHFHTGEEFWNEDRDYEYVFDENGDLTITLTHRWGQDKDNMSEEKSVWNVTYQDGLPCSCVYTTDLGTYNTQVEWQPNGLPAKHIQGGGETYEYLANGRTVLPSKHYGFDSWGGINNEEYFYDEHFDMTGYDYTLNYDDGHGTRRNSYTEYEYDRYGNWISRKEVRTPIFWDGTEEGKDTQTVLQIIEYYE